MNELAAQNRWAQVKRAKPRIYFGPLNINYLSSGFAREFARRGYVTQWQLYSPDRSQEDLSTCLFPRAGGRARTWSRLLGNFIRVVRSADILHFMFGATLLPGNLDLPLLRLLGKRTCMTYVGSDLRVESSDAFCAATICRAGDCDAIASRRRSQRYFRLQGLIDEHLVMDPTLFPSPRLYPEYFPRETTFRYVPFMVDTRSIAYRPRQECDRPRIVHIPSNSKLKGTEHVLAAFDRLRRERPNVVTSSATNLSHADSLRRFADADIVIDQVLAPFYGLVTREALAMGRVVVSYLPAQALERIRLLCPLYDTPTPPIVSASPENLFEVLMRLLESRSTWKEMGRVGREFVESHHSVGVVCDRIEAIYKELWAE